MGTGLDHRGGREALIRRAADALKAPILLFLLCVGFFWKLVLTDQFTWIESPDLANQVLPWFQLQAGEWHKGRFPLWDPYQWGGQPLLAQGQPGAAYPPNWILFSLPLRNGWIRQSFLHWYYVLIHFQAMLFAYWLCRDLKFSRHASVLAGCVFGLAGYVGTTDWPQMINGATWGPLVLMFTLRAARGYLPLVSAALGGLCLGFAWLSGHHQIPIFLSVCVCLLWTYLFLRSGRPDWLIARAGLVFLAAALFTSGLQTIPAFEYGRLAKRWVGIADPVGWNETVPYMVHRFFSLNPLALIGTVVPALNRHADSFVGFAAVSLALLGWLTPKPGFGERKLFGWITVFGLLVALGGYTFIHGWLYAVVPMFEKARNPSMAIYIFHLGLVPLVAAGADALAHGSGWLRRISLGLFALAGMFHVTFLGLTLGKQTIDDRFVLAGALGLVVACVLWSCHRQTIGVFTGIALLTGAFLIEASGVSTFALAAKHEDTRELFTPKYAELADLISRIDVGLGRIDLPGEATSINVGDFLGVPQQAGYLASVATNTLRLGHHGPRVQDLFGVQTTISAKSNRPNQKEKSESSGYRAYDNPGAFPRAWLVHEALAVENIHQINYYVDDNAFDMRSRAFVWGPQPVLEPCAIPGSVKLLKWNASSVTMFADAACRSMVVLSDTFYPGWQAWVDGERTEVFEAYACLRGVVVEAGSHLIEFRFRPRSVQIGAVMTAIGILGTGAIVIAGTRRKRQLDSPDQVNYS